MAALLRLPGGTRDASELVEALLVAGDEDLHALGEGLGRVLGEALPDGAADEEGVAVFPLVRLLVEAAGVEGERNGGDGLLGLGEAEFGVGGESADSGEGGQRQGQFSFVVVTCAGRPGMVACAQKSQSQVCS